MLAYSIIKKLSDLWQAIDVTVEEVLKELQELSWKEQLDGVARDEAVHTLEVVGLGHRLDHLP